MSKKNSLSDIPLMDPDNDRIFDLPYIPTPPLPIHFGMMVCGKPNSGKTSIVTSLLLSHKTKKFPNRKRYYYKYFDKVFIVSGSLNTLPTEMFGLEENQTFDHYSDEVVEEIVEAVQKEPNGIIGRRGGALSAVHFQKLYEFWPDRFDYIDFKV